MSSSIKVFASDFDNRGQLKIRLAPKQVHFYFRVSVIVEVAWTHFYRACRGQKPHIFR